MVHLMICTSKYLYKIDLVTASDVAEFNKIATKCPGNVYIVNGENGKKKLNAKSFLGVHLARMAWNEIYVETDFDCYFDFEKLPDARRFFCFSLYSTTKTHFCGF